ncbi:protein LE25 [Nicotiana tabacum]|uniref:Protein LE25 n=2 Tax=Nicotiana TaxID=4085 RepID=A0A1S3YFS9_TOBAC|nr:PREDICTED: protein LE25-like [Nicotiana sylvestris]XP_016450903.1 PREDICTED: protein LE25-like [Nicotiana tabacum]
MQGAKEKAANAAASAKSGMGKTKATIEEKAERMTTRDPLKKEMATEKKDERKTAAELSKREANDQNAAARDGGALGYTTTGAPEYSTTAYDPTEDVTGGGGPVRSGHPTSAGTIQDSSFPC